MPVPIETEQEPQRTVADAVRLSSKGDENLSREEVRLQKLIARLVSDYETRTRDSNPRLEP